MKQIRTPNQVLDEAKDEFRWKFIYDYYDDTGLEILRCRERNALVSDDDILYWHNSTIKAFIEAEIERLRGMKKIIPEPKEYNGVYQGLEIMQMHSYKAYNLAIDDQIIYFTQLLDILKGGRIE